MSGELPPAASGPASLLVTLFVLVVVELLSARLPSLRSPALRERLERRAAWSPWGNAIRARVSWRVSQEGGAR